MNNITKYILIFLLLFPFYALAETGTDCITPDTRCSAYDLEVNAEVLGSINFIQVDALSLGSVVKGEVVEVTADNSNQSRGKRAGWLNVEFTRSNGDIKVSCIADSSYVFFSDTGSTKFDYCDMYEWHSNGFGNEFYLNSAEQDGTMIIFIGGIITVPSDATSGDKSGVMRIEVAYE